MYKIVQLHLAEIPASPRGSRYLVAELDRREMEVRMAAIHVQIHKERRAEFYSSLLSLWPIALGLGLSCCATPLHDAVTGFAPLLAKALFPLSTLAALHEIHFGPDGMPTLSQVMLNAQFILDGLLACMLFRQRSHFLSVCVQVALFHVLFLLCIGWEAGSFGALMMN